tara:strand:+ start:1357 stop:1695 length:339 start_codon:yes stop_codon:yes gene_type:complete
MKSEIMIEAIGFTAGILGLIAWIPQIIRVWRNGEHEGISLLTLASILTTLVLWVIYGLLIESLSLIISNSAALFLIGLVYVGVIRLRYFEQLDRNNSNSNPKNPQYFSEGML